MGSPYLLRSAGKRCKLRCKMKNLLSRVYSSSYWRTAEVGRECTKSAVPADRFELQVSRVQNAKDVSLAAESSTLVLIAVIFFLMYNKDNSVIFYRSSVGKIFWRCEFFLAILCLKQVFESCSQATPTLSSFVRSFFSPSFFSTKSARWLGRRKNLLFLPRCLLRQYEEEGAAFGGYFYIYNSRYVRFMATYVSTCAVYFGICVCWPEMHLTCLPHIPLYKEFVKKELF